MDLRRVVSESVWNELGEKCIKLIDSRILETIERLENRFGEILINDWFAGGSFENRGFRRSDIVGAKFSQHLYGRAIDFNVYNVDPESFRENARLGNYKHELEFITRIEEDVNWVHLDCASGVERIYFFKQ